MVASARFAAIRSSRIPVRLLAVMSLCIAECAAILRDLRCSFMVFDKALKLLSRFFLGAEFGVFEVDAEISNRGNYPVESIGKVFHIRQRVQHGIAPVHHRRQGIENHRALRHGKRNIGGRCGPGTE